MELNEERIEVVSNKKTTILSIFGILFLIPALMFGLLCFTTVIETIITNNDWGFAFLIVLLVYYGSVAILASIVALILNIFAYKSAKKHRVFKLIIMILSIIALVISISSFAIWFVGAIIK